MIITTSDEQIVRLYLSRLHFPKLNSHKGQNGKLLIIGGSSLFHAASLWSAAIASRLVDMVHYCSTKENEKIFLSLKTKFVDGIIVRKNDLETYIKEDDCILIGPGMMRGEISLEQKNKNLSYTQIAQIKDEPLYTYHLVKFLMKQYPHKKFVFDAGVLQMMEKEWLLSLKTPPVLTPHQGEFQTLFGNTIDGLSPVEKKNILREIARRYHSVILLKTVIDLVSDGSSSVVEIIGGNAGLTKGGTGDVLAGIIAALNTINTQLDSCITASLILKKSAEDLFEKSQFWFNTTDLIYQIPKTTRSITAKRVANDPVRGDAVCGIRF